jgi:ribosomal protein L28
MHFLLISARLSNCTTFIDMAKVCENCGKSTSAGQRKRHHHATGWLYRAPRTKRAFKPNLRSVTVNVNGVSKKMRVCMKCYKMLSTKAVGVSAGTFGEATVNDATANEAAANDTA